MTTTWFALLSLVASLSTSGRGVAGELQAMLDAVDTLVAERDALKSAVAEANAELDRLSRPRRELCAHATDVSHELAPEIAAAKAELESAREELASTKALYYGLRGKIAKAKAQLEEVKRLRDAARHAMEAESSRLRGGAR